MYDRSPIDRQASVSVSQIGCRDSVHISIAELREKITILQKKHRFLKRQLGITTNNQQRNLRRNIVKHKYSLKWHRNPQLLGEYIASNERISHLADELRLLYRQFGVKK